MSAPGSGPEGAVSHDAFAMPQSWDPARYAANARFVAELGMPVLELLAPASGERILDLGCGDGYLGVKLKGMGCDVLGVDASAAQVKAARGAGLAAEVRDARRLDFSDEFDAVFSNATLHWVDDPDAAIDGVWRALKPGGRFVAESGGEGCVALIRSALGRALSRRGLDIADYNPWYFPSASEYSERLRKRGFAIESIAVFPRPTPLPGEVRGWLETFAESFLTDIPSNGRDSFLAEVQEVLRGDLCDEKGKWFADYTRLRFRAVRPAAPDSGDPDRLGIPLP